MTDTPVRPTVAVLEHSAGGEPLIAALSAAGADAFSTTDPNQAAAASGLVLPGGADFDHAVAGLKRFKGERIVGQRLAGGRPLLAVGTGMYVLFDRAVRGRRETAGLGEWPGDVVETDFAPGDYAVEPAAGSRLFADADTFAFDGPLAVRAFPLAEDDFIAYPKLTWADVNGQRVLAAVENGPLSAVAFNPAASGEAGLKVLRNWITQLPEPTHA
mgnify:FL=1